MSYAAELIANAVHAEAIREDQAYEQWLYEVTTAEPYDAYGEVEHLPFLDEVPF